MTILHLIVILGLLTLLYIINGAINKLPLIKKIVDYIIIGLGLITVLSALGVWKILVNIKVPSL